MEGKSKLFNYVKYKISISLSLSFSLSFLSVKKKMRNSDKKCVHCYITILSTKKKKSSSNNVNVYKKETVLVKDIQQIQCLFFFHITRGINSDSPYSYNLSHWLRYLKICNTSSWKHFYEYIGNMI